MGSGQADKGTGICKAVPLSLQALEILDDFLPLNLGTTDVILGVQWLETLGETVHHWKEHTMKLRVGNHQVILQREPLLHKTRVSLKHMVRLLRSKKQGLWVELNYLATTPTDQSWPSFVAPLLSQFVSVFCDAYGAASSSST